MKEKNKKSTLNNHHRVILDKFKKESKKLPKYKNDLEKLNKKLIKLNKKPNLKCSDKEIEIKFELKKQISSLTKKIQDLEEHKEKTTYFLNTFDLLNDYFTNKQNCSDCDVSSDEIEGNHLLNFFKKKKDDNQMSMDSFINKKNKIKSSDIYEKFLVIVEPRHSGKHEFINNIDLCPQCKVLLL